MVRIVEMLQFRTILHIVIKSVRIRMETGKIDSFALVCMRVCVRVRFSWATFHSKASHYGKYVRKWNDLFKATLCKCTLRFCNVITRSVNNAIVTYRTGNSLSLVVYSLLTHARLLVFLQRTVQSIRAFHRQNRWRNDKLNIQTFYGKHVRIEYPSWVSFNTITGKNATKRCQRKMTTFKSVFPWIFPRFSALNEMEFIARPRCVSGMLAKLFKIHRNWNVHRALFSYTTAIYTIVHSQSISFVVPVSISMRLWSKTEGKPSAQRAMGWKNTHLIHVNAVIQRPHGLKVILHALFEFAWHLMQHDKILQITPLTVVLRTPCIHPLYYCRHITENDGMHQSCQWKYDRLRIKYS